MVGIVGGYCQQQSQAFASYCFLFNSKNFQLFLFVSSVVFKLTLLSMFSFRFFLQISSLESTFHLTTSMGWDEMGPIGRWIRWNAVKLEDQPI